MDRPRHYIITLQSSGGSPFHCSTQHGIYEGDADEQAMFLLIWREACRRMSSAAGRECTLENTMVLFYRLVDQT